MHRRILQAVLHSLAELRPPASDGDLLGQVVAGGGEAAFAELVRRHGRLVWVVCRQLTNSEADAEDAFQATFLILLQNAGKIRDAARLSAWLYGVAHKVCGKARLAAQRRAARELAKAKSAGNGAVVPDSAWDRALAAVHEEAACLPETLRLPFILCCLEGKGVSEAAAQLRWKVGTLSARLARAKDAVLTRLGRRGLTLGAVAGLSLAIPPSALLAKTVALPRAAGVVSGSLLHLTKGVIGMSTKSVKLLAAATVLACGIGIGLGTGWVGVAKAQPAAKEPGADAQAQQRIGDYADKLLQAVEKEYQKANGADTGARVDQVLRELDLVVVGGQPRVETYTAKTAKWEYDLVQVSDMGTTKFIEFLQDRETRGWEFNGQTTLQRDGKSSAVWVFRRPARSSAAKQTRGYYDASTNLLVPANADEAKVIAAEIARLQARLQALTAKTGRTVFSRTSLPLEPGEFAELLKKLVQKRFPGQNVTIVSSASEVTIEGDPQIRQWISGFVKKLSEP